MAKPKLKPKRRLHLDRRIPQILANEPPGIDGKPPQDDDLLTTELLADWLGQSVQWVEIGRLPAYDYGPPYEKLGSRLVGYMRGKVRKWLQQRWRAFTSARPREAA